MMGNSTRDVQIVAFGGERLLGSGSLAEVVPLIQAMEADHSADPIIVFDSVTSELIELDLRGSVDEVVARVRTQAAATPPAGSGTGNAASDDAVASDAPRGPGRPRLGVVAREVTLLPRHWSWLAAQPGGASAALRRLVDHARSANSGRDRIRRGQESAYRFMSAMLGDAIGFEDATRALFAGDRERFATLTDPWPTDLRDHARRLAAEAFPT